MSLHQRHTNTQHTLPVDPNKTHKLTQRQTTETDAEYKTRMQLLHTNNLIHSIVWLIAAIVTLYYTELHYTLYNHDIRLYSTFYYISIVTTALLLSTILYIVLVVQSKHSKDVDLMTVAPTAIYTATALSVILLITLVITIWPIYSLYSIPIVGVVAMATVLSTNFIP